MESTHESERLLERASGEQSSAPSPARPIPAIKRFAVLTAFLVPIAVIPYLMMRRHMGVLRKELNETRRVLEGIEGKSGSISRELAATREANLRAQRLLEETKQEVGDLRQTTRALHGKWEAACKDIEASGQDKLGMQKLLEEMRRGIVTLREADEGRGRDIQLLSQERDSQRAQLATLRELGRSLGDIAAFMHEVELEQGFSTRGADQRGIERLRLLALGMQRSD